MQNHYISQRTVLAAWSILAAPHAATAQTAGANPPQLITPDRVETRIGTLEFKDGVPTVATAEKVRDTLDFARALNAYNNRFRGASAYAIRKGFQSIGAEDNTVVIYSNLMDAKSLFLTANADTVYYMGGPGGCVLDSKDDNWSHGGRWAPHRRGS